MLAARTTQDGVHLRRADSAEPVPAGWRTHPAGTLDGVRLDFLYRPDRHDICRAIGAPSLHLAAGLRQAARWRLGAPMARQMS